MRGRKQRREATPLDKSRLDELALAYVGRFATTRAKLGAYLSRKIRERGWAGEGAANLEAVVERLASLGYVDDAEYALSKARSLTSRGYGPRRVNQSLHQAGIGDEDGEAARALAAGESVEAALRFARRRRIGPFAAGIADPKERERILAAMIRAGHGFEISKAILSLRPGEEVDVALLEEKL
jgi:regulatory protein